MKTAQELQTELERWLRGNAGTHRRQAMLGERKGAKAIQTAKADVYEHVASMVAQWQIKE